MKPILYESTETLFENNGLGVLSDCQTCYVDEERNGLFTLEAEYPITGRWYKEIKDRRLILAKPNMEQEPQPFRITRITPSFDGKKTVAKIKATHWSYDLSGVPVLPFAAANLAAAVTAINSGTTQPTLIQLTTDKSVTARMQSTVPRSFRQLLGGMEGSLLDCYGGEYRWNRYTIELLSARGSDKGFSIRYGKNMTKLEQDRDSSAVYTGVYPYWASEEGAYIELPERIVAAPGVFDFSKVFILDLSSEYQEMPTEEQLRSRATSYIINNGIGVPNINTKVSYAQHPRLLDAVHLCDTVHVYYDALGVDATAKVIKTRYNVLKERYEEIELGNARSSISNTIVNVNTTIDDNRREQILLAHEIRKELEETFDSLRASITDATTQSASQLKLTADALEAMISRLDKSLTETMDANSATWAFVERVQQLVSDNDDAANDKFETIERYIRFLDGTVVIGILGNQIKLKLMNDTIFFFAGQDDTTDLSKAFAYFTKDELHVKKVTVEESISMGPWVVSIDPNNDDDLYLDIV